MNRLPFPCTPPSAWLLAFFIGYGCAQDDRAAETVTVRDSAGITIVENAAPRDSARWHIEREPVVVIGGDDQDTTQLLFNVAGAVVTSRGEIVIAQGPAPMIRWYSPDGTFLRGAGRAGGGPGEFGDGEGAWIHSLWLLPGDSIGAWEHPPRRMQVFSPDDAQYVRSVVLELPPDMPVGAYPQIRGRLGHGFAGFLARPFAHGPTGEVRRDTLTYIRYHPDGRYAGVIADLPGFRSYTYLLRTPDGREGPAVREPIFAPSPASFARDNRLLYSPGERFEISVFDTTGALEMLVRRTGPPEPVTDHHVALYREVTMARAPSDPAGRRQWQEIIDGSPVERTLPAIRNLRSDRTGAIWVQNYPLPGSDSLSWSVFDAGGRWLSDVLIPADWQILDIGEDYILALWRDALDVEHVRRHVLRRATSLRTPAGAQIPAPRS